MSEKNNNLGAILCPSCRKLISASAEKCPYCGMKNPNMWGMAGVLRKMFGGDASLIPVISAVCIGVYVISILLDPGAVFRMRGFSLFGLGAPSPYALIKLGMTGSHIMRQGQWWTLITAIYLHGGLLHILFNVLWIRQIGPLVEELYGISRSFVIFTIAGVLGYLVSNYVGIPYTIGASGSIFGFFGAIVYYGRKRGGAFGTAIYRQMGQWALVLFVIGFIMPGGMVNNFAHGGGFVGGYAAAAVLGYTEMKTENHLHQLAAIGTMLLTVLSFILALLH